MPQAKSVEFKTNNRTKGYTVKVYSQDSELLITYKNVPARTKHEAEMRVLSAMIFRATW